MVSLMLVGSKAVGDKADLKPRAKTAMASVIGSEPTITTGSTSACQKALTKQV